MLTTEEQVYDKNEARFTRSCVPYKKFRNGGVRSIFHYLRDREDVLIRDIDRFTQKQLFNQVFKCRLALQEVKSILIWMFTNLKEA